MQQYVELTVDEANKLCKKNARVLVAINDLTVTNLDLLFTKRRGTECEELFDDAQTILRYFDDFVKQINIFTEKQDKFNIVPHGMRKVILLR